MTELSAFAIRNNWFVSLGRPTVVSRRQFLMAAVAATTSVCAPVFAQKIVQIGRASPDRKVILDVVRVPIERRLGIKVIFVVDRMTLFGDWAFAALHPRNHAGNRIDYRRTLFAKDFDPEQDSDSVDALLRRNGASWSIVEVAFLPTDVVWVEWEKKYKLPRALFFIE
jgi:hypothetical protein